MDQYLATSFRPDCDFVEGVVVERNLGQKDHSKLQREVLAWCHAKRREFGIAAFPEQRVRVSARRFRIPDVCLTKLPEPDEQVFTQPPYICVEVLSSDDAFPRVQERFDDYLRMGVVNLWLLDPEHRRGWSITEKGHLEALDGMLRPYDGEIAMPIADLFPAD